MSDEQNASKYVNMFCCDGASCTVRIPKVIKVLSDHCCRLKGTTVLLRSCLGIPIGWICFPVFSDVFRECVSRFFPYCFSFCFCWECFTSTRSSRKGRGRSTKASVTVTKGGNRKGIPLTRDFFALSLAYWFRVSLGSVSCL